MRFARGVLGSVGALCALTIGFGGLGYVIARRVTAPVGPRRFDLVVQGVDVSGERPAVIFTGTAKTAAPGEYNLILEDGEWVRLGASAREFGAGLIARDVLEDALPPSLVPGARVSWSGIIFRTPAEAGLNAREVEIATPVGAAPAWLIEPDKQALGTWAIHIHGLGSSRAGTLRGVRVAAEAGMTSLVVSYRNDGDGPEVGTGRSTLAALESDDVEAAVQFALEHGAQRIILFGWSMGGAIALELGDRSGVREHLVGIVLESPVLDWVETIKANCARAGMPRWVGTLAVPWLDSPPLARLVGLAAPVSTTKFDHVSAPARSTVPILLLQGTADSSAPYRLARRFAERGALVDLVAVQAEHTFSWNRDPEAWRMHLSGWLSVQLGCESS